jgi:hypothetical protein
MLSAAGSKVLQLNEPVFLLLPTSIWVFKLFFLVFKSSKSIKKQFLQFFESLILVNITLDEINCVTFSNYSKKTLIA